MAEKKPFCHAEAQPVIGFDAVREYCVKKCNRGTLAQCIE
jgi:hypothetical protein